MTDRVIDRARMSWNSPPGTLGLEALGLWLAAGCNLQLARACADGSRLPICSNLVLGEQRC